ncbi:hypothetical protein AOQ88_00825 [Candidatus Riesia sp. GBBU]|nr:hypothetical protein AOQ88_00825 [Candidatus Riesia sp. GBBU]
MNHYKKKVIFIMGPTSSGKTKLSIELSKNIPITVISVDSLLVYRGMDIGTAKPTLKERKLTPHKLIDILDPSEFYSAGRFCLDALKEIKESIKQNRIPVLTGGCMFYFKSLLNGMFNLPEKNSFIREKIKILSNKFGRSIFHKYLELMDPKTSSKIHCNDFRRISRAIEIMLITGKNRTDFSKKSFILPYKVYQFALLPNIDSLRSKIKRRFINMLKDGFENEVRILYERNDLSRNLPSIKSIGYKQMWSFFSKEISYEEMIEQSILATYKYVKKQVTWINSWQNTFRLCSDNLEVSTKKILKIINN